MASGSLMRAINRWLPWIAGFVFIAGVVTAATVFLGRSDGDSAPPRSGSASPPPASEPGVPVEQKRVPLSREARIAAGRFILTAVTRENLAEGWKLASPELRQGMTYKEWLTGNIPVQYYPADAIDTAPLEIQESYRDEAVLRVAILAKKGAGVKSQLFVIGLEAVGQGKKRRWLVNYFQPYSPPGALRDPGAAG